MLPVAFGSSSELIEHFWSTVFTALIVGSNDRYGWVVGQKPGQPKRFNGSVPSTVLTKFFAALLPAAKCWMRGRSSAIAAVPVTLVGFTSGAKRNDVPAPDSNASSFMGCFEYS